MLDEKNLEILTEVCINPKIKSNDLQSKYGMTRRQIDYRFNKINDWLKQSSLPEVQRNRQGNIIINPIVQELFVEPKKIQMPTNIPNETERANLILLMLLSMKEDYSLNYFMFELEVSKTTILNDLKIANQIAESYDLKVVYSRKFGYGLAGPEFNIRRLLIQTVINVLGMFDGEEFFKKVTGIFDYHLEELYKLIEVVEKEIDLRFTDEKIRVMPFIISVILKRIELGKIVDNLSISYHELIGTKEYMASEKLFLRITDIPLEERLFLTLKILSTNISASSVLIEEVIPELKKAIQESLNLFEKLTLIDLQEKDDLLNKILLHIKPAYYRIKYNLTVTPTLNSLISNELQDLHYLVKKSFKPLAEFLKVQIPDEESKYLTMLVGGWLTRQGDSIQNKQKAIVVCPNGVSISKLLSSKLSKLFPEFIFIDSLSIREFETYHRDFQIVFSTEVLKTDKKLFIVDPFMTNQKKFQLKKQVNEHLNGFSSNVVNWDKVIELISKNAEVYDREAIINDLCQYFNNQKPQNSNNSDEELKLNLFDLVTVDHIQIVKNVNSYEEAIMIAAQPLLEKRCITPNYVEKMIEMHVTHDPYAVIGNIAIPHAGIEDGVNQLSMSLLKIDEGIQLSTNIEIYFIVVIAPDKEGNHIRALQQIDEIAFNENAINALRQAESNHVIWQQLNTFTN